MKKQGRVASLLTTSSLLSGSGWSSRLLLNGHHQTRAFAGVARINNWRCAGLWRDVLRFGCTRVFVGTSHQSLLLKNTYAKGKGKKGKHDDDDEKDDAVPYEAISKELNNNVMESMTRSIDYLREEYSKLRLGRANPDILNRVKVNGVLITKKANIFVRDTLTLSVIPFEKEHTKDIIQAIQAADLDLTPQVEADSITIRLPKATKEARDALIKQIHKIAEELRISLRRTRQNVLNDLKKKKDNISKDDFRKLENEVQKVTDEFMKKVDQLQKAKEKDIMDQ